MAIDFLCAADPDPNADAGGVTPLRIAEWKGNTDAVRTLLLAGADPNAKDTDGRTPGNHAAATGHADSADALLAANSLPSTPSGSSNGDVIDARGRRFRIFELKDTHGFNEFTLIYNRRKVAIDGMRMRLSLTRRECNAHILDRFKSDMATLIGDFTRKYGAGLDTAEYLMMDLRIRIDGKNYIWSDSVRTGHDFLHLPREIHRMKWEEKFACSPNRGSGRTQ